MKTTKLSIPEFLSVYTGFLIGDDFNIVKDGVEKIFGIEPYTGTVLICAEEFQDYINKNRKDLVEEVSQLGKIHFDKKIEIQPQISNLIQKFEKIHGSKTVEVATLKEKEEECEM